MIPKYSLDYNLEQQVDLDYICQVVQTMCENEYVELLTCLLRVVWAAAAGKLFLASMGIQSAPKPDRVYIGRRSRDSSTGSSGSLGSEVISKIIWNRNSYLNFFKIVVINLYIKADSLWPIKQIRSLLYEV